MARLSTQLLISLIIFVFPAFPLDSTWVPRQTPYLNNITIRVILRLSHLVVSVAVAVVFTPYTISVAAEQKFTPATPVTLVILMLLQAAFWAVIGLPVGIKTWRYRFWHWRSRALLVAGFWLLARAAGTFPIPQTYHPICHVVPNHEEGEEEKETPNNASEMVGPLAKMFAEQKEEEEASQEISSQDTNAPEKREEPIIPRPTFIGIKRSHPKMSIHPWIKYWAVTVQIQRDKSKETSRFRLVNVLSSSSRYIFALLFWVWVAVTSVLSLALEIFAFSQGTQNGRLELCVNKW
ncbi:hypothetical protein QBC44DRAFT_305784 [Cladorrhinum sp. PSN332]|nr:hypothetical protein QBC44DRAFT_305784 [Cladorrhinum sp. PSN332]